jgi:hypothetical protein
VSAPESRRVASTIPIDELIVTKCNFFLDTIFWGFYTFVNCKVSLAGSMSTRQRENRENGNQESSSKEASEEGSQENRKEEVSGQRNRQHNRGTPKASPDVFLSKAGSLVFMHLRRRLRRSATAGRDTQNKTLPCLTFVICRHKDSLPFPLPAAPTLRHGGSEKAEKKHILTKVVGHDAFR